MFDMRTLFAIYQVQMLLIFGVLFLNEIACSTYNVGRRKSGTVSADKSNWSNIYMLHPDVHIEVMLKDSSKLKGTLTITTPEFISMEITSVIETKSKLLPFLGTLKEQKEEKRIERQEVFRIIRTFKTTKYGKGFNAVGGVLGFWYFFLANKENVILGLAYGVLGSALGVLLATPIGLMIDLGISAKEPVLIYEANEVSAEGKK